MRAERRRRWLRPALKAMGEKHRGRRTTLTNCHMKYDVVSHMHKHSLTSTKVGSRVLACLPAREAPAAKPHTDIHPSLFANAVNFFPPLPTIGMAPLLRFVPSPSPVFLDFFAGSALLCSLLSALNSALVSGLCCYRRSNSLQQQIPSGKVSPETDGPRSPSVVFFSSVSSLVEGIGEEAPM